MSSSISLSTPIAPSEDGDDRTLGDTLTDPRAEAAFEAVENADYNESLHSAFVDIIQRLPSRTRPVMLCRLEGMGKLEILTVLRMDDLRYRSLINQISQALYNDKAGLKKLEQYLDGKKQYAKENGYSLDYITDF